MGTYKKINGQAVPVTTEGHPQYYFQTKAQAEAALSTLEVGADVFVEEGSNEDVLPKIEQIESDLTDVGTITSLAVGSISGSGAITHPDISDYKTLLLILRAGSYIADTAYAPLAGWNSNNNYAVQYYDETQARHLTMHFAKASNTSTNLTLVSPDAYFSGWSYQIIGVK